jgi:hypothetical protein
MAGNMIFPMPIQPFKGFAGWQTQADPTIMADSSI